MTTIIAPPPLTRFMPADPNPASLEFARSSLTAGMPTTLEDRTVPQPKLEDDLPRGRPRSRSHGKDSNSDDMADNPTGDGDANGDNSSNSDGPARKRRRSRKGLDKKFECPHIGCGKSYSRAEHLHRHQLNHTPKQIYVCDYPGCERHFVRLDLCNRHRDRHTAKGSALNRKDSMPNQGSPTQDARPIFSPDGSMSPDAKRPSTAYGRLAGSVTPAQIPYSPKATGMIPYSPISGTPANAYSNGSISTNGLDYASRDPSAALFGQSAVRQRQRTQFQPTSAPQRPIVQTNVDPYGIMSPVSVQQGFQPQNIATTPQSAVFVTPQAFPAFTLPPSDFAATSITSMPQEPDPTTMSNAMPYTTTTSADFDDTQTAGDMTALDQLSLQNTMPMFGTESILQKSPYVGGMPEDFVTFLFNSTPQDGSPMGSSVVYPNQYASLPYYNTEASQLGYFPVAPQQIMSVTNLLDQNPPESIISDEKSQELYDMIKERFHDNGNSPIERHKDLIMEGDRSEDTHMLSRKMMQVYIVSYWLHFSDQVPILHKPTFSPDRTPNLLLIAIMTIGAACLDKAHGHKILKAGAELSNFLAWNLRWMLFMDNLRPPAKLWVFQTLLLVELYEKMYSSRELHERAHIHHATTITLMRRGRALMGKTTVESPPNHRAGSSSDNGRSSRHSSTSGPAHTGDHWWDNWIENEATRRTAFTAFVIDSIHATMFGHSTVMVAHEMRLPLPCDERLWKATNGAEVGRLEAQLASEGVKHVSFLEGLKRTLNGLEVKTNPFGRTILMAGLLSISWHMNQRDLQVNSLGPNASQALGGRDKWRGALTRAFDSWKGDFDKSLKRGDASSAVDPYAYDSANSQEVNVVFESRVVLHHLAHMAMQVDVVDLQICARAKRLLGRAIGSQDIKGAQRRMKDLWAPSARARDATYYALQFLCSVLLRNEGNSPLTNGNGNSQPDEEPTYAARDDVLLNRPWVLYFAALVVWCYGYALEGPSPESPLPSTRREQVLQMKEYLHRCGSIASPEDLKTIKGINQNSSLLQVLKDAFSTTRWELLHEGSTLLGNCIQLNQEPRV